MNPEVLPVPSVRIAVYCLAVLAFGVAASDRVKLVRLPVGAVAPDAEIDSAGVLHAAYFSADNVFYVKSTDSGTTFSEPLRINSEAGSAQAGMFRGPDLSLSPDGTVHTVWFTNGYQRKLPKDQWGAHYARLTPGAKTFEPARNLNKMPSDCFSIAANSADNTVAVFWIAAGLFVQLSRDNGKTFAAPIPVAGADPCECCGTRAYFGSDGALFCAYREKAGNIRDMHLLRLPKGASKFERTKLSDREWKLNACPMTGNSLNGSGPVLLAAWETSGQASFARLDGKGANAAVVSPEVKGVKKFPLALLANDGTVMLAWKYGKTLNWQLYDKANAPIGTVQQFEAATGDRAAGAVMADGTFLLLP